jgi:hypothetical protein
MVEARIKPYHELMIEKDRREKQQRAFRRNQIFGMLLVAVAILLWGLWRTNPSWIFPQGWWRL